MLHQPKQNHAAARGGHRTLSFSCRFLAGSPAATTLNVTPIRQIQMARFDGKRCVLFGDVLDDK